MPFPDPELHIRKMVGELAALHPSDVEAILEILGSEERRVIEELLQECSKHIQPPTSIQYDLSHLSPWLQKLFEGMRTADAPVTSEAQEALLGCVAAMYPVPRRAQ